MKTALRAVTIAMIVALLALATAAAPALAGRDSRAPRVSFVTEDEATVTQATPVTGVARDKGSGIKKVVVTYCPGSKGDDGSWTCTGLPEQARAELDCNSAATRCDWSAAPPVSPGWNLVFVKAVDGAKNKTYKGPREIFVLV